MKELRHCSWVRGCGCPRRDTPPCLSPCTIPSRTLSLLSVGAGCRVRTYEHTQDISAAQCPSPRVAPAEEPKDVLGLCDGETVGDVSPHAGARLGCIKAKESKDQPAPPTSCCPEPPTSCCPAPTSSREVTLLTEAERDPASSSGSSASVSL